MAPIIPTEQRTIYLPPVATDSKDGIEHCLIVIQGAQIQTGRYLPIAKAIQRTVPFPLHVVIPNFTFDLAIPTISIRDTFEKAAKNLALPENCPKILLGHSIGTAAIQREISTPEADYVAAIIMGASVVRENYASGSPIPVLTLNGELDGLHRVRYQTLIMTL